MPSDVLFFPSGGLFLDDDSVVSLQLRQLLDELQSLGRHRRWPDLIRGLIARLSTIPDPSISADREACELLLSLRSIADVGMRQVPDELIARGLAHLHAWHFRAVRRALDGPHLWNPLDCDYERFVLGGGAIYTYLGEDRYPPSDYVLAHLMHCLGGGNDRRGEPGGA